MFSTLIPLKRLPMVPVDSSAAKIPLPGAAIALAVSTSSAAYGPSDITIGCGCGDFVQRSNDALCDVILLLSHSIGVCLRS